MQWLDKVVDEVITRKPDGEILVESGSAPSGPYHVGHLREIITADAIVKQLIKRGRQARQIHFVDDFDALRKIPAGVPKDYEKYLGQPLADIPAPNGQGSYADYIWQPFEASAQKLGIKMDVKKGRQEYKAGLFTWAIESVLENSSEIRKILEDVSGRKLEDTWSPIQIMEDEYLKKRSFVRLDKASKTVYYLDKDSKEQSIDYDKGQVKLDWRIDWPARWSLLKIDLEPSGRDHSTKGGSIDTGMAIQKQVFKTEPPIQVAYDFVNLTGDTKKMSASAGTGIAASEILEALPPEIVRFFMLRYPPQKRLYFDPIHVAQLIDEYAGLLAKTSKSEAEKRLVELSGGGLEPVVSNIPFTHLVATYQASRHKPDQTLKILERTGFKEAVARQTDIIKKELVYIDSWLKNWAPENLKFNVEENPSYFDEFSDQDKQVLNKLAEKIESAPENAGGEWFHKAIYTVKEENNLKPEQIFRPLYKSLINKDYGPRAGYFLADLAADNGRDWLIKRLKLEA